MKNFEQFVGVDWSGSAAINTPSIAVAVCGRGDRGIKLHPEIRSRTAVFEYLKRLVQQGKRTLIGIDANFGYCAVIGTRQFGKTYTAFKQWERIEAICDGAPNFYAKNFWTHPDFQKDFWVEGKMPVNFQMPRRMTETQCIADGYGTPESPFKLIGAKQVGKGGLAAQRLAWRLRQECGDSVAVWPFDNEKYLNGATIVLTEIFPRQFIRRAGAGNRKLRMGEPETLKTVFAHYDAAAPRPALNLSDHDLDALISAAGLRHLCGTGTVVPAMIAKPPAMTAAAARAEGWIFGVGDKK